MPRATRSRPTEPAPDSLERFLVSFPSGRAPLAVWLATHPLRVVRAARDVAALPLIVARPGPGPDGRVLAVGLARRSALGRRLTRGLSSVIRIPEDPESFTAGNSRKTLRKQRNIAVRSGVHWERVDDGAARSRLLELANASERSHPDERYRTPFPDNGDLLALSGWWTALSSSGEPLLLAVVAIDGDWSLLRYFRVLQHGEEASAARYYMTDVVVQQLAARGVRVLATDMSPVLMNAGLRDFQHRVGFELVRIQALGTGI